MNKYNWLFYFKIVILVIAVVAMSLSIYSAITRNITIVKATIAPDGILTVTYHYPIGRNYEVQMKAYIYDIWVNTLRRSGWQVVEAWK